ncbi:MAG: TonB-dependent receptor [Chitinophagaceae bacterium]|nr:TonB-dependent receptor [Chitinophagaceae bacterium]
MKQTSIFVLLMVTVFSSYGQRRTTLDTTKPTTVVVTSSFKPTLRGAAKINFSAATPAADTNRPNLYYTIPSQNLFFTYQPTPLQPLALTVDTGFSWQNNNYVKAGYGNFTTPYVRVGLSFGDGVKSVVNVHAKHVSSKGQLPFQQFSKTNITGLGIFNANNKTEWNANAHFDISNQFRYGFKPETLVFTKDSLKQNFSAFGARLGLRNKQAEAPIDYNPSVGIDMFNDNRNANESTLSFALPVSKRFGRIFSFGVGLYGDVTALKTPAATYDNNLFYLTPAVQFKTPNVNVNAGFTPSWDNSTFNLLPNFTAEAKIKEERFVIQLGWVGYYHGNTYQNLSTFNPWIAQPTFSNNTRVKEQYAGVKGSAGNHFTYNSKISLLNYNNVALFINDTVDGKTFNVMNAKTLRSVRVHGEVGYTVQEKFAFLAGVTFNQFSNLAGFDKPYGLLPLEITGSLRWHLLKDLSVTSDVFFWDGPQYRTKINENLKQKPGIDMNLGIELGITPKFSGWLQFNNLFNNDYQRWNQYRVLGFNVLAGVVYSFGQQSPKK